MCGIVGELNINKIDLSVFNSMRDVLTHRGPDGAGTILLNDDTVGLGHRRLSIIDLTDSGKQPMSNEDGSKWITFNGEIYNYQVLRTELLKCGHTFRSTSDTEVILHGYEQWGNDVVNRLNGMFAFGLWDDTKKQLLLARDRFGIKPLHYSFSSSHFCFASEIKALLQNPSVKKRLDANSLADFFVYRFIPSPNSIWCDIKKLPPGHTLTYKVGGEPVVKQYWKLPVSSLTLSPNEVLEKCEQLVNASVQSHLLSDVPVGLFLSGGYDSSLMAYYMHRLGYPINSFTIGFKDWERSEHLAAQEISKIYDGSHTEQILDNENLLQVEDLAYYYDEPLGGSSFLPTYYVSKLAASKVKVVLSGDGGDEVFAGYKWHKSIYHKYYTSFPDLLKRKVQGKNRFLLNSYWNMMSWAGFHYNDVPNVLGDLMSSGDRNKDDVWYYKKYLQTQYGPVKAFQLLDFHSFLPEVVLTKVDRASMANSLEVRVPLLDHDLAEFVMSLQEEGVFDINQNKKIIRSILSSSLPQAILNRPKSGFGAPVKNVDTVDLIARVRDSIVYKENLINRKYFEEQIVGQRNMKKAWAMFVFSAWANKWL